MINDKKVDAVAKKISSMYVQGITEVVETLLEATKDLSNKEVGSALKELNMEEVVKTKLSNIKTEYRNAHVEVLEDVKPPVNND